jgi:SulP family sulfate permease
MPGPSWRLATLRRWPGTSLPVETIGSRFGSIPQGCPVSPARFPGKPPSCWSRRRSLIALLGACVAAVRRVATSSRPSQRHDSQPGADGARRRQFRDAVLRRHAATGTIARTVTNLRSGATSPVAGIVHALTVAFVVLAAAPLAVHVPLAVLAGILLFVAWNMGEWHEFAQLKKYSTHYRLLMLGTFFLTVVFDLTVAVQVGLGAGLHPVHPAHEHLVLGGTGAARGRADPVPAVRLAFFGAVAKIDQVVQAVENGPDVPVVVLDALQLVHLDTSGLDSLRQLHKAVLLRGGTLFMENLQEQPREVMERAGFAAELAHNQASPEVSV